MTVTDIPISSDPAHGSEEVSVHLRFPASLALCIIAAVFTTGSHPRAVANVVERYVARHGRTDGARALQYSIAGVGGARAWAAEVVENRKPANTHPGAPLKAEVIEQAVSLMVGLDIDTVPDLQAVVADAPAANPVLDGWTKLPSQRSGATYHHLLTIAGLSEGSVGLSTPSTALSTPNAGLEAGQSSDAWGLGSDLGAAAGIRPDVDA